MTSHAAPQAAAFARPNDDQANLWLPPRRMRRYQLAKVAGGSLMAGIFTGWLIIQWQRPVMRWVSTVLIAITAWVIVKSLVSDLKRSRGRQLAVNGSDLVITTPAGTQSLPLNDVARARWRDEPADEIGLWLYDDRGAVLARLDAAFVADQTEAGMLLAWLRKRSTVRFPVRWPQ